MSDPKDKKAVEPPASPLDDRKQSGRVGRDARGNAVWEWESETGVYSRDVSTQRLKKLEAKDLAFLDTGSMEKTDPGSPNSPEAKKTLAVSKNPSAGTRAKESEFNPYDSAGRGAFNSPSTHQPPPDEPKPKRRSIQSIVAEQNAKNKKAGGR